MRTTSSDKTLARLYLNDDLINAKPGSLIVRVSSGEEEEDSWSYDGSIIVKTLTNKISTIKASSDLTSVSMRTIK